MPSRRIRNERRKSNEAQKSAESDCAEQSKTPKTNLVYDFLYHDVRRVASFLSQFETYGTFQLVKATEGTARASATKTAVTAGGEIPLILKGSGALDNTVTDTETDAADRTYDPLWKNATRLLAWLRQHGLIEYDLAKARIGQFVIVSGSLIVLDLAMLKNMRELKPIRDTVLQAIQGNNAPQPSPPDEQQGVAIEAAAQVVTNLESEFEAFMAIISILPPSVQARLIGNDVNIWCGLEESGIVGKSSDLLLKHGTLISGEWSMLGILLTRTANR